MLKRFRRLWTGMHADERGFTLVELLIVVVIIGILAGIGVSGYRNFQDQARVAAADAAFRDLQIAMNLHEADPAFSAPFPRNHYAAASDLSAPADPADDAVVKAILEQVKPAPEALKTNLWNYTDHKPDATEGKTGFIVAVHPADDELVLCVFVNGSASRFNSSNCSSGWN